MLYEDETVYGAIKKSIWGKKPGGKYNIPLRAPKKPGAIPDSLQAVSHRPKQNENLPMHRGFGRTPAGARISGTGARNIGSFADARRRIGQAFERLAHQHYPRRANALDHGQFNNQNMIPELSTYINVEVRPNRRLAYSYADFFAGTVNPATGSGEVSLGAVSTTVAVVHAHWINTTPSPNETRGRRGTTDMRNTDIETAERIRERHGDHIRLLIYKWNGIWGEF